MKKVLVLAGLAGMVAANAEAIDYTPYVGLDANYGIVDTDTGSKISSKDWSLSAVLGARTDRFGLEAFYNLGKEEDKGEVSTRLSSWGVDALVFQDLGCSGRWELVGSAGIAEYKLSNDTANTDKGMGERLGLGVQYALSENTTVRAMYRHAWIHDSVVNDVDEFTVGFRYAF